MNIKGNDSVKSGSQTWSVTHWDVVTYQISVEYLHPLQKKVQKTESGMTNRRTDRQTEGKLIVPFGFAGRGLKTPMLYKKFFFKMHQKSTKIGCRLPIITTIPWILVIVLVKQKGACIYSIATEEYYRKFKILDNFWIIDFYIVDISRYIHTQDIPNMCTLCTMIKQDLPISEIGFVI